MQRSARERSSWNRLPCADEAAAVEVVAPGQYPIWEVAGAREEDHHFGVDASAIVHLHAYGHAVGLVLDRLLGGRCRIGRLGAGRRSRGSGRVSIGKNELEPF